MSNGKVKFFNNAKGFGFITPDSGEKDVFVHKNNLIDNINEGDEVSYDIEERLLTNKLKSDNTFYLGGDYIIVRFKDP